MALTGLCATLAAGCVSCGSPSSSSAPTTVPPTVTPTTVVPITAAPTTVAPTTVPPPPAEQAGWTAVSETPTAIVTDQQSVVEADGSHLVVARFRAGRFRADLHVGSSDPPVGTASISPESGSVVGAAERPLLLAAFNGGFQTSTGSGGFEVEGVVLKPLVVGLASMVTYSDGSVAIGVWGQSLPIPGTQPVSVRQNLQPLVTGGAPSPLINSVSAWGATLGGGSMVARSGLAQDAAGNLLYVGSSSALPADLASALVGAGATTAMELDINPEWVQLDLAATPGGALVATVPGQRRSSDQYLTGWTRDFVAILAGG